MKTAIITAAATLVLALALPVAAWADGELDPSFGSGGTVLAPAGGEGDVATGVVLDPRGDIVAAGWAELPSQTEFSVERFLPNGAVDGSFGSGGAETAAVGTSGLDLAHGVALDSLGRVVLAGSSKNGSHEEFGVARFTASGQIDTSFNGTGVKTTAIGPGSALGFAVAVDAQNRILVAGTSVNGISRVFTIARYLPNGELDPSFGSGGIVNTPLVGNDTAEAMAIDPQGRIVLAGFVEALDDDVLVARYLPSGELDPSFGGGTGFVRTAVGSGDDSAAGVAIDPQGRIVVAGKSSVGGAERLLIARYGPGGALDPSFGNGGVTVAPVGDEFIATGVALDAQGRALVVGREKLGSLLEFGLVRFRENGTLDPTFGAGGAVATQVGTAGSGAGALAIDAAGHVVAAGFANAGSVGEFALARYIGDNTPPGVTIDSGPASGSFTNDPTPSFGFSSPEPTTRFACGLGGAGAACSSPFTSPRLADGAHTFALTGTDPAGNTSAAATRTFTVDTKAPRLKIKGRRKFVIHGKRGRAKFKIEPSEPVTLRCKIDHGKPKPCKRREKTPKLKPGKHVLRVTATDRAGNVSQASKRFRMIRTVR